MHIRRKTRHTKSKTGCRTCKQRKVKCDEARPTCAICRKGGYRCEGYEDLAKVRTPREPDRQQARIEERLTSEKGLQVAIPKWSAHTSPVQSVQERVGGSWQAPPWTLVQQSLGIVPGFSTSTFTLQPSGPYKTAVEQRAFKQYSERTLPLLVTYSNPEVWEIFAPSVAYWHEPLRNAIIATVLVSEALHLEVRRPMYGTGGSALEYLNRALRAIRLESPRPEIILVFCVFMNILESFNHNARLALVHVNAAARILEQYRAAWNDGRETDKEQADRILNGLAPVVAVAQKFAETITAKSVKIDRIDYYSSSAFEIRQQLQLSNYSFRALDDSRNNLGAVAVKLAYAKALSFDIEQSESPSPPSQRGASPESQQKRAEEAFEEVGKVIGHFYKFYKPLYNSLARPLDIEHRFLMIHYHTLRMILRDARAASATPDNDRQDARVREIISLIQHPSRTLLGSIAFAVELGLIPPLFYFATAKDRCSSGARLAAINCLRSSLTNRVERAWTGYMAGKIAQDIYNLQQSLAARQQTLKGDVQLGICPKETESSGLGKDARQDLELWLSFTTMETTDATTGGRRGGAEGRTPTPPPQRYRCSTWTAVEVAKLPVNIDEIVRNCGYQGYFHGNAPDAALAHMPP